MIQQPADPHRNRLTNRINDFDGEVRRYGAVIRDGANPVSRLNIITNTERAADFLGTRARSILGSDIDIEVTVQP